MLVNREYTAYETYSSSSFKGGLRRSFQDKFWRYEDMRPVSSQPERIYATAKTYTFNSLNEINVDNLKFRPIISQNLYLQCSEGSSRISKTTM